MSLIIGSGASSTSTRNPLARLREEAEDDGGVFNAVAEVLEELAAALLEGGRVVLRVERSPHPGRDRLQILWHEQRAPRGTRDARITAPP